MESNIAGSITTVKSVDITSSYVRAITAEGNIDIKGSDCEGKLQASGDVTAYECKKLGPIASHGFVSAVAVKSIASIQACHVSLQSSIVEGSVISQIAPHIVNSTIKGTLACSSSSSIIMVEDSIINTLRIAAPELSLAKKNPTLSEEVCDDVFVDVEEYKEDLQPCVLTLKGSSKVYNINFVRLNGMVIVDDSAFILPSNIIGGKVVSWK